MFERQAAYLRPQAEELPADAALQSHAARSPALLMALLVMAGPRAAAQVSTDLRRGHLHIQATCLGDSVPESKVYCSIISELRACTIKAAIRNMLCEVQTSFA